MKKRANLELKFIVSLIFAVIVSIFAIQNAGSIEVKFFFANIRISQAVVILGSAIVGAIIVHLLGLVKQLKHKKMVKQMSQQIETLELENNNLQAKVDDLSKVQTEENEDYQFDEAVGESIVEDSSLDENIEN